MHLQHTLAASRFRHKGTLREGWLPGPSDGGVDLPEHLTPRESQSPDAFRELKRAREEYKKDGPVCCWARFEGDHIKKNTCTEVYAWVGDIDGSESNDRVRALLDRLSEQGFAYWAYTSFSHALHLARGQSAWRIVLPLAAPVPAQRWPYVWRQIACHYDLGWDEAGTDASHMWLLPRCPTAELDRAESRLNETDRYLDPSVLPPPPVDLSRKKAEAYAKKLLKNEEKQAVGETILAFVRGEVPKPLSEPRTKHVPVRDAVAHLAVRFPEVNELGWRRFVRASVSAAELANDIDHASMDELLRLWTGAKEKFTDDESRLEGGVLSVKEMSAEYLFSVWLRDWELEGTDIVHRDTKERRSIDEGELVVRCAMIDQGSTPAQQTAVVAKYRLWVPRARDEANEAFRQRVMKHVSSETSLTERWLRALCGDITNIDLVLLEHWLYNSKRRYLGYPTYNDYLLLVTGPQGAGKTEAVRRLLSPWAKRIGSSNDVARTLQEGMRTWSECIVIRFDEMARLHKADANQLKNMITEHMITARPKYGREERDYPVRASFIGTSEHAATELGFADIRRIAELKCLPRGEVDWTAINGIDYQALWDGIDPLGEDPWHPGIQTQVRDRLESASAVDPVLTFLRHCCRPSPDVRSSSAQLFDAYRRWCTNNGFPCYLNTITFGRRVAGYSRDGKWSGQVHSWRTGSSRGWMCEIDTTRGFPWTEEILPDEKEQLN